MNSLRRLALRHRRLAGLVLALALAVKLLMPAGFMPTVADGRIIVSVCSGAGPATMVMTLPGTAQEDGGAHDGKPEPPCAFAALAAPVLGAVDAALLAVAILFVRALGVRPVAPPPAIAAPRLRPPLRGPPLPA